MEMFRIVLESIEAFGIIIAFVISILTLKQNNKLLLKKSKSEILTKKRSERIDLLRKYAASILSEGELKILGQKIDISNLINSVNNYASLLQYNYEYEDDVKLIKLVHKIKKLILSTSSNKKELKDILNDFYYLNDFYVSIEYSRMAFEIKNNLHEYDSVETQKTEAQKRKMEFEENYKKIRRKKDFIY